MFGPKGLRLQDGRWIATAVHQGEGLDSQRGEAALCGLLYCGSAMQLVRKKNRGGHFYLATWEYSTIIGNLGVGAGFLCLLNINLELLFVQI